MCYRKYIIIFLCVNSWHEIGTSDIPAMLDYVLEKTDRKQLIYAGHSQGTTGFFVMASELPEYQDKVKAMIALAPVAYLTYIRSPFFRVLATFGNNIGVRNYLRKYLDHFSNANFFFLFRQ